MLSIICSLLLTRLIDLGSRERVLFCSGDLIPDSALHDFFSDTNPIVLADEALVVAPATVYGGSMFITPGLGTLDEDGQLKRAWLAAKALVRSMEIVCEAAGLGD